MSGRNNSVPDGARVEVFVRSESGRNELAVVLHLTEARESREENVPRAMNISVSEVTDRHLNAVTEGVNFRVYWGCFFSEY